MDTFASLALATEEPTDKLLDRMPASRDDGLISPIMARNILGQAIYQCIILICIIFYGEEMLGVPIGRGLQKVRPARCIRDASERLFPK